ncbi:MAG TPA: hypothetical protein DEH24_01925 [Alteromonas sp.]|nr:hypothetical protein [Alteromonadaceae bacterium]MAX42794.1 hypothetical protein [Alteromonadaceae bacterium]HBY38141.1 hypothetical protein [Alteromonas sp.]
MERHSTFTRPRDSNTHFQIHLAQFLIDTIKSGCWGYFVSSRAHVIPGLFRDLLKKAVIYKQPLLDVSKDPGYTLRDSGTTDGGHSCEFQERQPPCVIPDLFRDLRDDNLSVFPDLFRDLFKKAVI